MSPPSRVGRSNASTENAGIDFEVCNGKPRPENLQLYKLQKGEKKRGQAIEVCQSHKGNDLHSSRRLGKHGTCRRSQEGLATLKVGKSHQQDHPLPGRFYRLT